MSYVTETYPGGNECCLILDALITDRQSPEQLAEMNGFINKNMNDNYDVRVRDKNGVQIGQYPRQRP